MSSNAERSLHLRIPQDIYSVLADRHQQSRRGIAAEAVLAIREALTNPTDPSVENTNGTQTNH